MSYHVDKPKYGFTFYVFIFFLLAMGIVVSGYVSYRNFEQELTLLINGLAIFVSGMGLVLIWWQQRSYFYRRQAEVSEALRASEEKFRRAFFLNPDSININRMQDGMYVSINNGFTKITGYTAGEVIGRTSLELNVWVDPEDRKTLVDGLVKNGEVVNLDARFRANNGDIIHGLMSASVLELNGVPHLINITRDISERRRAEEALRENEAIFKSFMEHSPVYVFFKDKDIRSLRLSKNFEQMLGLPLNELLGKTMDELFPSNLSKSMVADDLRILNEGKRVTVEEEFNGRIYETTKFPVLKDDKPYILAGFTLDITERRQIEEALHESEETLRVAFDNAPTGMSIIGPDGFTYLAVNPLLCEMFGYTVEEFLGETVNLVTHPDDVERSDEWIQKKYNDEPCEPDFEKRYIHKDGHIVWGLVRAQWIRNEDGSPRMAIVHILDITARKQAEEALRESEMLYRQAIEVANAVPYRQSYTGDGVEYDFIGAGIRQITGYSPVEFSESLWDSLTQERLLLEDLAEYPFNEAIERVRSGISPVWKCEHLIRARDGRIHWVFEAAVELRDANGVSHGSIGLYQDITERKLAEEEIRKWNAELEQRVRERTVQLETTNKELEAFSYSVSHDLRAPLRGIDGWSQALLEDYGDLLDEKGRQYLDRVRSETQHMGHLIDDMLQLSRLTRIEMFKEPVNLSTLADSIVERLKLEESHRHVEFSIQPGLIAKGDSHLLEAVLANLLGNALKFTGKREDARIEFGQTELKGQRVFFVRDNGAGFDMAYSQKMFGPFQRMHKASEFPGTGVGLAIVQRVIHRHGGHVWAESEVGRGATFYFTLEENA